MVDAWLAEIRIVFENDRGARIVIMMTVVLVVVGYGEGAERFPELFAAHADCCNGAEGVCEERGAASDRVADAVEKLKAWGRLKVEKVHMEAEV